MNPLVSGKGLNCGISSIAAMLRMNNHQLRLAASCSESLDAVFHQGCSKFNSIQSDQLKVQFKFQYSPKAQKRNNELWKSLAFSETVPGQSQTEVRQAARRSTLTVTFTVTSFEVGWKSEGRKNMDATSSAITNLLKEAAGKKATQKKRRRSAKAKYKKNSGSGNQEKNGKMNRRKKAPNAAPRIFLVFEQLCLWFPKCPDLDFWYTQFSSMFNPDQLNVQPDQFKVQ